MFEKKTTHQLPSKNHVMLGFMAISLYCLFTSISAVWVTFSFSNMSGLALTFITLFMAQ